MAEDDPLTWEDELESNFLDNHSLFWAIHKKKWGFWKSLDEIDPNAIEKREKSDSAKVPDNEPKGMSVDWEKYCINPQITLNMRADKTAEINGIVKINVEHVRECYHLTNPNISLLHKPVRKEINGRSKNRAHSLILNIPPDREKINFNEEFVTIRALLVRKPSCQWVIRPILLPKIQQLINDDPLISSKEIAKKLDVNIVLVENERKKLI